MKLQQCVSGALVLSSLLAAACSGGDNGDDAAAAGNGQDALSASGDEVVQCSGTKGDKKGKVTITFQKDLQDSETKEWKHKVVPIGFSGNYDDQTISHSQGDQPDVVSIKHDGKTYTMTFVNKQCAGSCGNTILLTKGAGENDSARFIRVEKLTIDTKQGEFTIDGTELGMGLAKDKPSSLAFKDCKAQDKLIDKLNDQVDPG
jgi:hypothetical protein